MPLPEKNIPVIDTLRYWIYRRDLELISTVYSSPVFLKSNDIDGADNMHLLPARRSLRLLANVSMNECAFLLTALAAAVRAALSSSSNVERSRIPASIPSDIRTVIDSLAVEPEVVAFVCCPGCFYTYKVVPDDPTSYPEFCTYQRTPKSKQCRTRLQIFKRNKLHPGSPISLSRSPSLDQSNVTAAPDIEEYLDTYPTRSDGLGEMKDIWDGSVLREFCGPDKKPYLEKPENEGRLIFGLNLDGFGPYSKKKGGKGATIDGIYLVCLNLPPELRYKAENMCLVGLVPGPKAPSLDQINHVLRPLVDDLLGVMVEWHTYLQDDQVPTWPTRQGCHATFDMRSSCCSTSFRPWLIQCSAFLLECDLLRMDINNLDADKLAAAQPLRSPRTCKTLEECKIGGRAREDIQHLWGTMV